MTGSRCELGQCLEAGKGVRRPAHAEVQLAERPVHGGSLEERPVPGGELARARGASAALLLAAAQRRDSGEYREVMPGAVSCPVSLVRRRPSRRRWPRR
jgi:hypothetical protein